jgi:hypothetical protein
VIDQFRSANTVHGDTVVKRIAITHNDTNKDNLNDGAARDFHDFSICAANVHTNFSTKICMTQD